jgi:hypothetical protein
VLGVGLALKARNFGRKEIIELDDFLLVAGKKYAVEANV